MDEEPVIYRNGIHPKRNYKQRFPLPRRKFQRDEIIKDAQNGNAGERSRYHEDDLRSNMKQRRRKNIYDRRHYQTNKFSAQDRINAIRSNKPQNTNGNASNHNDKPGSSNSNNRQHYNDNNDCGSEDSVDMGKFQFNVNNIKDEEPMHEDDRIDDDDNDDDDVDDEIGDLTVQVVNDKAQKDADQVSRFKMVLDAKTQLAIKKIQKRNKVKQVIYPYPVTPHQTGLTTHERFTFL